MLSNVAKGWYAKVYFDDPEDAESGDGEGDEDMSTSEFTEDIASAVEPLESMASEIQNSTAVYNATSASSTMTEPVYATTSSVQPSSTINLTIIENHHPSPKSSATVSMPTQSPSGISSSIISPSLPSPPLHKESPQLDPNASMSPGIPLHNGYNKYGHPER
ncbi:hypothetical protein K7432_016889 [Basidiobolus ranarum]|uniref:Uncharacterized protein n=1 Tax=Basidiobolus ranarum TaxID=34480 RepID=A0ABR2WE38_9FUNG